MIFLTFKLTSLRPTFFLFLQKNAEIQHHQRSHFAKLGRLKNPSDSKWNMRAYFKERLRSIFRENTRSDHSSASRWFHTQEWSTRQAPQKWGSYVYYLSKYTDLVEPQTNAANSAPKSTEKASKTSKKSYLERDLRKLFSTYLHHIQFIYSKTIFHENSNFVDKHQIWTHPDMVGIHFLRLKNTDAEALLHTINREESFTICAYELKRSIHTDTELKECFFKRFPTQAGQIKATWSPWNWMTI